MSLCSPFIPDNIGRVTVYADEASLPTSADERYEGKLAWVADVNTLVVWDGTGWYILDEPVTSYTPTLTNITLGSGALACTKRRADGYCDVVISCTFGAGMAVSGSPTFTLPHDAFSVAALGATQANLIDTGTGTWIGQVFASAVGSVQVAAILASGTYAQQWGITSTVPFTWVSTDAITFALRYRLADPYL